MAPSVVQVSLHNHARMEQQRVSYLCARLKTCSHEGRAGGENHYVGVAQEIFSHAELNALDGLRPKWKCHALLKPVKAHVIIPEKPHVIGKGFLHSSAAHLKLQTGTEGNVSLGNGE